MLSRRHLQLISDITKEYTTHGYILMLLLYQYIKLIHLMIFKKIFKNIDAKIRKLAILTAKEHFSYGK